MNEKAEQEILANKFGVVTNKRVTYYAKKGWFSGGSREDVPLNKIVSVRHENTRNIFWGVFNTVLGIILIPFIIGIVPLIAGIFLLIGSPQIIVTTSGSTTFEVGFPWEGKKAEEFTRALKEQLFEQ